METSLQRALPSKCPMTAALNAVGGKWSLICLFWLDSGTRRFNELRRLMPDISHKVLAATLRHLEQEGLVCRTVWRFRREWSTVYRATENLYARLFRLFEHGATNTS